jgi:hypothetical protein
MAYQSYVYSKLGNQSKYLHGKKFPAEICTDSQRHLLIAFLILILKHGNIDDVSLKFKKQTMETIKHEFEITMPIPSFDMDSISYNLSQLTLPQSEIFMLYFHEFLTCNGRPSYKEYQITIGFLDKFFKISKSQYHECLNGFKLSRKDVYLN